jgi:hypothetical protein
MGIRFYCPNGHKMHVKDFQAGQKGLCPTCGIKLQIPWQSTRRSSKEGKNHPEGGATEVPPSLPGPVAPVVSTPASPQPSAKGDSPIGTVPQPTASVAPPAVVLSSGMADALTEAGGMVWYVRPPSGGQFGPAAADIMRAWLTEGRVSADALVWREGWRDWQEAGRVFPQLSSTQTIPGLDAIVSESLAAPVSHRPLGHRSQTRRTQATIVGGLVAAVLILFAILLAVVFSQ